MIGRLPLGRPIHSIRDMLSDSPHSLEWFLTKERSRAEKQIPDSIQKMGESMNGIIAESCCRRLQPAWAVREDSMRVRVWVDAFQQAKYIIPKSGACMACCTDPHLLPGQEISGTALTPLCFMVFWPDASDGNLRESHLLVRASLSEPLPLAHGLRLSFDTTEAKVTGLPAPAS